MHPSPRRSPLHSVHAELGAAFTEFAGWTMPVRYTGELAEHRAVREAAGIFDLSHMAEIEVTGPAAGQFLDYALIGKLGALAVGRARYTMLCQSDGGIIDDLVVYRLGEQRFLIVANAANTEVVVRKLTARCDGFDARVADRSTDFALIAVQGPQAVAIVTQVTDAAPTEPAALKYYGSVSATVAGREVLLARTGYTGEDGYELYVSPADAGHIWQALSDIGAPLGLRPAGLASRDTLRLEAGMPLYGNELTTHTTPFEAGLGRLVKLDKPDFVGKAALVSYQDTPPARVLVGLRGEGKRAPRHGYRVLPADDGAAQAGSEIGEVTSGALSPTLGYPVAMAYVPAELNEPGRPLWVDIRGRLVPVAVTSLPFYRRDR